MILCTFCWALVPILPFLLIWKYEDRIGDFVDKHGITINVILWSFVVMAIIYKLYIWITTGEII